VAHPLRPGLRTSTTEAAPSLRSLQELALSNAEGVGIFCFNPLNVLRSKPKDLSMSASAFPTLFATCTKRIGQPLQWRFQKH